MMMRIWKRYFLIAPRKVLDYVFLVFAEDNDDDNNTTENNRNSNNVLSSSKYFRPIEANDYIMSTQVGFRQSITTLLPPATATNTEA